MKLGFFSMPIHPIHRSLVETLNEDREFAIIAEKLGFVEGLFGEHLTARAAFDLVECRVFAANAVRVTWRRRRAQERA